MKLKKNYKIYLITLFLALLCAVCLGLGVVNVYAERSVTIDGANFFYANDGADVRAYRETLDNSTADYTMFLFGDDDDNVTYRYNLAYHWYEAGTDDNTGETDYNKSVEGWFNLVIGFSDTNFDRYTIKFQSQQYVKTEDAVTTNYITFVNGVTGVYVIITDDEEETETSVSDLAGSTILPFTDSKGNANRITIEFTDYVSGVYSVKVSAENDSGSTSFVEGEFKNVGNSYAKRVNSTTAGVMPLTFSATFDEDATTQRCEMVLYSMNGQSFELTGAEYIESDDEDPYYDGGTVTDDCPPVLCVTGNLSYLEYGEEPDFDYVVIDVLASSPKLVIHYYVLSEDLYNSLDDFNTMEEDDLYINASSDDKLLIESGTPYLTSEIITQNTNYSAVGGSGYYVGCLAKVYVEITDVTSTVGNNASTCVFLDWYLADEDKAQVTKDGTTYNFVKVISDERGATYGDTSTDAYEQLVEDYQAQITELSTGSNRLSAGSTTKFDLPAFTGFLTDNLDNYEDLTYSIYYMVDGETNSNTSLSYNNLYITLSEVGTYRFTIYAADRAGNHMYYIDENGKLVEFEGGDIYDDEIWGIYVPVFEFTVHYTGATIEDPGEQTTGYVGTEYSISSFTVNGVSGTYTTSYDLYWFDRAAYNEDNDTSISYSEFVEQVAEIFEDAKGRTYFYTIKPLADLNENDEDYDDYADYEWSSSSLTFIPQDENCYYLVRLTVTDTESHLEDKYGYMAIHVSAKADSYSGESQWLQNNIVSVVLFSIAGASLIGIIVLFVVKPKESGDIDEQMEQAAAKAEAKAAKKAAKKEKKAKKGNE